MVFLVPGAGLGWRARQAFSAHERVADMRRVKIPGERVARLKHGRAAAWIAAVALALLIGLGRT